MSISPIPARESFLRMVRHTFLMEMHDPAALEEEFRRIAKALAHSRFRLLRYPRTFDSLAAVRRAILSESA